MAAAPCPAATGRSLARGIPPTLLPPILEAANAPARPQPRSGAPHRASAWLPARPSPGEKWLRLSPSEGARPGRKAGACGTRSMRGAVRDFLVLKGKTHTCKHKPALLRHRSPVSKFHGEPSVSFAIMQQKEAYAPQRQAREHSSPTAEGPLGRAVWWQRRPSLAGQCQPQGRSAPSWLRAARQAPSLPSPTAPSPAQAPCPVPTPREPSGAALVTFQISVPRPGL